MGKERVTEDLIDGLPIAGDHALLVQVDEVALDELGVVCGTVGVGLLQQVVVALLQRVAEGLQLLEFLLSKELFDYLAQQVHVPVIVLELVVLAGQLLQQLLVVVLLGADDDCPEEVLEGAIILYFVDIPA